MLVILLENHSQSQALAQMPHLAAWGRRFGQATNYHAITHPSLPNYLAIWGGSTFGVTSDCTVGSRGCAAAAPSVFGQTIAAHHTARAYQESMATTCQKQSAGSYAPRHSPWPYWAAERGLCRSFDVPSGTPSAGALHRDIVTGRLPTTGELTPNFCHDGHDCPLSTADAWLTTWVRQLVAGPDYRAGRLTIVITFDEDDFQPANRVAFVVIDPRLHGKTVTAPFNHYSLTRWLCGNAGVPMLRKAAYARPLRPAFGL
jgi:acid phosphatase